jgi:FMN phosphatase YigB (HAD superfamily)
MSIFGPMKPGERLVVFDIGNVLVRLEPRAAFRHAFGSDAEIDALFDEVGFYDWNYANDRGRARVDAVATIAARWQAHQFNGAEGLRTALTERRFL